MRHTVSAMPCHCRQCDYARRFRARPIPEILRVAGYLGLIALGLWWGRGIADAFVNTWLK